MSPPTVSEGFGLSAFNQLAADLAPAAVEDVPAIVDAVVKPVTDTIQRSAAASTGWTLAVPPTATDRLPRFDQSAVDGFAWSGSVPPSGLRLVATTRAGDTQVKLRAGEAVRLMTGAPIPAGADRVAMQERCRYEGTAVYPPPTAMGENIRLEGEDIAPNDVIASPGTRIDARHSAVLAATGISEVTCVRPLRVHLVATGNELSDLAPEISQIRDSNTPMLRDLLLTGPDIELSSKRCTDRPDELRELFDRARDDADLIVTIGGMSFGQEDYVRTACTAAGGLFAFQSLLMKPGKPVGLAQLGRCIHLGLPGNPFAALVAFVVVGLPVLDRLRGREHKLRWFEASADFSLERRPGRVEFFPIRLTTLAPSGGLSIQRLGKGGSARLAPLVAADGLGRIDAEVERVGHGDRVRFLEFANVLK